MDGVGDRSATTWRLRRAYPEPLAHQERTLTPRPEVTDNSSVRVQWHLLSTEDGRSPKPDDAGSNPAVSAMSQGLAVIARHWDLPEPLQPAPLTQRHALTRHTLRTRRHRHLHPQPRRIMRKGQPPTHLHRCRATQLNTVHHRSLTRTHIRTVLIPVPPPTHTRTLDNNTHPQQSLRAAVPHLEEIMVTPLNLDVRRVHGPHHRARRRQCREQSESARSQAART